MAARFERTKIVREVEGILFETAAPPQEHHES